MLVLTPPKASIINTLWAVAHAHYIHLDQGKDSSH